LKPLTTHCEILFDKSQPLVCIGEYSKSVDYLLRREEDILLSSKNLWIDYRVIPLFQFYNVRNINRTEFFFIECSSTEEINVIIESKELANLKSHGFSSLVLNYPPYLSKRFEVSNILDKLASLLTVIILTSDPNFPMKESQIIRVDK